MSDLLIDLANYIVENEPSVDFEEAQELVCNMDDELAISKNIWGSVTGKHLNTIDRDKSKSFYNGNLETYCEIYQMNTDSKWVKINTPEEWEI